MIKTCLDFAFAVVELAQFCESLIPAHQNAVMPRLEYIIRPPDKGSCFSGFSKLDMNAFSDSTWGGYARNKIETSV